jgi:NAD(P)H dehydrogenase (quinone)
MRRVAVTGATGRIGGAVARALAAEGVPLRLVVRDPSRAPRLPGAQVAQASYDNGPAVLEALHGVDVAFMVSGAEAENRLAQHMTFVAGASAAGVRHLVYLSFVGGGPEASWSLVREHFATEQRIREGSWSWTFLRDNLYADFLPMMVGDDDVLRGPAGSGRAAMVAQADVAAAAVAVLRDPAPHAGATYDLTGPEAVSLKEAADLLSEARGRPVRYVEETVEEAYASRAVYAAPPWQVDAWVGTYLAIADGSLETVSGDVEALTGRPSTPLRTVLGLS